jgi:NhaP-type Na+/H+ or K+/H+ antiporter
MKRMPSVLALAGTVLCVTVAAAASHGDVLPGVHPARAAAPPLYAYNKNNPQWEAPQHEPPHGVRKPYKPMRQPPGSLPPRRHHAARSRVRVGQFAILALVSVVSVVVAAEWLSGWLGLPSALPLLLCGLIAGPATQFVNPDLLFGNLLFALVAWCVGLVLFSTSLSLRNVRSSDLLGVVGTLATRGMLVNGFLTAAAAHFILALDVRFAALAGALLVMTSRAALGSLLQPSGLSRQGGRILEPEAVVLELVGAALTVLMFEVAAAANMHLFLRSILRTVIIGSVAGVLGAGALLPVLKGNWLSGGRRTTVVIMAAIAVFALSYAAQPDAAFVAMLVMGVVLAAQRVVEIGDLSGLDGALQTVILPSVFLVLVARLRMRDVAQLDAASVFFVAWVMLSARPAAVGLSTLGESMLSWRQRVFLSTMAPRSMLAVAFASLFPLHLKRAARPEVAEIVPLAIMVIGATTILSAVAAARARRWGEEKTADYRLGDGRLQPKDTGM